MELENKCSHKKHSELSAICICIDCNLYLCNKCTNIHKEYLENHQIISIDKNNKEIFTGLCTEPNHKGKLEYYCKNHNKLCCSSCISKIKGKGNGQHSDCEVCFIEEIVKEKKNKLNENIKYLEESCKNIEESLRKLKEIYEEMIKSKEEIKTKISKIFTKIRNLLNEREDQLLLELDNMYDKLYFKEELIKKGEKIPNKLKAFLEKGTLLNNEWENDKKLINKINDCINIEYSIKNIIEINENIGKCNLKKFKIKFKPEGEEITEIEKNIELFGEIINENEGYKFLFQPGNNYNVSNNGLIATKNNGKDDWNCVIIGNKAIPKDRISKWKIKINQNKRNSGNHDICVGIGPYKFKGNNFYDECWSIDSGPYNVVEICIKGAFSNYNNHNEKLKEGDIIEIIVDRNNGNLSFAVNDVNYGIACSTIPKEDDLYPTIIIYEQGLSVEII